MFNKIYRKKNKYFAHIIFLFVINATNGMFDNEIMKESQTIINNGIAFHQHTLQNYFPNNFYANMLIGNIQIGIGMNIENFPLGSNLFHDEEESYQSFKNTMRKTLFKHNITINEFKGIEVKKLIFPDQEEVSSYENENYTIFYQKNANLDQDKINKELWNKKNEINIFLALASREISSNNVVTLFFSNDGTINNYFHLQTFPKMLIHIEESFLSTQITTSKNAIIPIIKNIYQSAFTIFQNQQKQESQCYFQQQQVQQQHEKNIQAAEIFLQKSEELYFYINHHYFPNNFYGNLLIESGTQEPIQIGIGTKIENFPLKSTDFHNMKESYQSFQRTMEETFFRKNIAIKEFKEIKTKTIIFPDSENISSYKDDNDCIIFYQKNTDLNRKKIEEQLHDDNKKKCLLFVIASRVISPNNFGTLFFLNKGKQKRYVHSETAFHSTSHIDLSHRETQIVEQNNEITTIINKICYNLSILFQNKNYENSPLFQQELYFQPQSTQQQQQCYVPEEYFQTQQTYSYQQPPQEQQYDFPKQYLSQKEQALLQEQQNIFNNTVENINDYFTILGRNVILSLACFDKDNNYKSSIGISMQQPDCLPSNENFKNAYDSINSFHTSVKEWLATIGISINQSPEDILPNSFYEKNVMPVIPNENTSKNIALLHPETKEQHYNSYGYIADLPSVATENQQTDLPIKKQNAFNEYDRLKELLQPTYKKYLTFAFCIDPFKNMNLIGFFRIPTPGCNYAYTHDALCNKNIAIKFLFANTTEENVETLMQKSPFMNNFIHFYENSKNVFWKCNDSIVYEKLKKLKEGEKFMVPQPKFCLPTNAEKIIGALNFLKNSIILTLLLGNEKNQLLPITILLDEPNFPNDQAVIQSEKQSLYYFETKITSLLARRNIIASLCKEQLSKTNFFVDPLLQESRCKKIKSQENKDEYFFIFLNKNSSKEMIPWEKITTALYHPQIKKKIVFAVGVKLNKNYTPDTSGRSSNAIFYNNVYKDYSHSIVFYSAPFKKNDYYYLSSKMTSVPFCQIPPQFIQRNVDPLQLLSINPSSKLVNSFAGYYQEMLLHQEKNIIFEDLLFNRFLPKEVKEKSREIKAQFRSNVLFQEEQ